MKVWEHLHEFMYGIDMAGQVVEIEQYNLKTGKKIAKWQAKDRKPLGKINPADLVDIDYNK